MLIQGIVLKSYNQQIPFLQTRVWNAKIKTREHHFVVASPIGL